MIADKKDKILEITEPWTLNDPDYLKRLNEDRSQVLWLHGDPGKGNMILAIAQRIDNNSSIALVYFFYDSQASRRRTSSLILRGIFYQNLYQRPDLAIH